MSRILERLTEHAGARPHASAFRGTETVSYAMLLGAVKGFAARVREGAEEGSVIAITGTSGAAFAAAYLGTLAAGCIVHPVPRGSTASELCGFLRETGARGLVGDAEAARGVWTMPLELAAPADWNAVNTDGPGLYLPSSGTTGLPKIAVRSRASLDAVAANVALAARLTPEDVVLSAVPMSHSYGMENGLLGPIWAGACIHVVDRGGGLDTGDLPRDIETSGATVFPAVPFMVDMLAQLSSDAPAHRLRRVYTAGSPLPREVAAKFASRYGVGVGQLYGATEVGSVTYAEPGESGVGRPLPGVSILILDIDEPDASRPCAAGIEGQVAIRAESMLSHYLDGDRNDPAFLDGYFLTGDLGCVDERAGLTITGRLKLLIDVGGFKVNPLEVERTLLEHPGVGEIVVLPMRVTETVSRLRALVAPKAGPVDVEDLRAFARTRLSPHKVPRIFQVVSQLPKSATGKILRRELEARA